MTVNSIKLTGADGSTVETVPKASPMEMMQLMANVQPVSSLAVTQGTYTQAVVSFSNITMGYMDPVAKTYKQTSLAGPYTATVPFSPAMTVGTSPVTLNLDMDMGSSVAIDGTGKVTIAPVVTAAMAAASGSGSDPWQGTMQHRIGVVSSISGAQFTMGSLMGMQQSTFATNASTQFAGSGFTGMGSMVTSMMVDVDAAMQADGSYLAQRVESLGAGSAGMLGGGLVTAIAGNPPTQIARAANGGQGGGMTASSIGGTLIETIPAGTTYSFDSDGVDLANLPFTPAFGPSNVTKGQRVDVVGTAGMMGGGMMGGSGSATASQIRLEQQGLHGLASALAVSGAQGVFTLTLSADSAFTTLTGASTIQIYQQAGTQLHGISTLANGNEVQVRGLLFNDAGVYRLVSTWITAPN